MSTIREVVYMILDEFKNQSDDRYFEEEHIQFLIKKYRAFLLKQRYADVRKDIPNSNYQEVCMELEQVSSFEGDDCNIPYLRSKYTTPVPMSFGTSAGFTKVTSTDYWKGNFNMVSMDRFKYVGYNKWLKNMIYTTTSTDNYIWFKSNNPQYLYLKYAKLTGIFEDYEDAFNYVCPDEEPCELLDRKFPLEEALIPPLLELVRKELLGPMYAPKDNDNNAKDDLINNN